MNTKTKKYKLDKGDYEEMRDLLSCVEWEKEFEARDTLETWGYFSAILEKTMQTHIPTHTPRGNHRQMKRQSYMDKQGMKPIKVKQRAWKHYTDTEDQYDYQKYCTAKNKLRNHTRDLRQNFEDLLAAEVKTNPKAFWKYTKSKLTVKSGVGDLKDVDGKVHSEDEAKAVY